MYCSAFLTSSLGAVFCWLSKLNFALVGPKSLCMTRTSDWSFFHLSVFLFSLKK